MDGGSGGMSFRAFEKESEGSGWINGKTHTYPLESENLDECLLVFGLLDKNGQELFSTASIFPNGTKRIQDRATVIFLAYAADNYGSLPSLVHIS